MLRLQTLTWLLSVFTFALAAPASPAHSSLAPRSTPDLVPPPAPTYLPYKKLKPLSDFVPELAASDVAELMLRGVGVGAGLEERGAATPLGKKDALKAQILIAATCVDSSASDVYISSVRSLRPLLVSSLTTRNHDSCFSMVVLALLFVGELGTLTA